MVQVSEADNGREIGLTAGEAFDLTLPETSGAGFKWVLASNGQPAAVLEKEDYISSSKSPGSSRTHRWRFRAQKTGTATLELAYGRSWEKVPVRNFTLRIRIQPPA